MWNSLSRGSQVEIPEKWTQEPPCFAIDWFPFPAALLAARAVAVGTSPAPPWIILSSLGESKQDKKKEGADFFLSNPGMGNGPK